MKHMIPIENITKLKKSIIFTAISYSILFSIYIGGCNNRDAKVNQSAYHLLEGKTMGTYYHITYNDLSDRPEDVKQSIESLLKDINREVSTYIPESFISKINNSKKNITFSSFPHHFKENIQKARLYYDLSDGYFDVSVLPLINYWGFGYTPKIAVTDIDSMRVDSLKNLVGLNKWKIEKDKLVKRHDNQQLDFSALAKGYAVDEIGRFLSTKGCNNYLVDIGGEELAKGKNPKGNVWSIGISTPSPDAGITDIELVINLKDMAVASSGNYRNYHDVNGYKYGHTLDPKTGYPYQDELLAVSIITDDCIDADAIATACMAMGYRKAIIFMTKLPDISACFIIGAEDGTIQTKFANGFIQYINQR